MPEPNHLLTAARRQLRSSHFPGEPATRAEVADAVNTWLWETTHKRYDLSAHYLAKLERGVARWPNAAYRSGLRHVLCAPDDATLGFHPPRRHDVAVIADRPPTPQPKTAGHWDSGTVLDRTGAVTDDDLMPATRRTILTTATTLTGAALAMELEPFLRPVVTSSVGRRTRFTPPELDDAEQFVSAVRAWRTGNGTLPRQVVVAQLNAHTRRLREAPQGTTETIRAFRVAAELADIAATMTWDAGHQATAQRYFVLSAQLAHAAGDDALAAVALASLARQCYDLNRPDDGLEIIQLAQYATRRTATPRLRAVLATREAWAYALRGEARAFIRTVRLAEDYHAEGPQHHDAITPSARSLDAAELAGVIGARYRDLAHHHPGHARHAQDYITRALALRDPTRGRNRAFDLIGLARAYLITREPERAADLIGRVLPAAGPWMSGRVGAKLHDFHREAAGFADVPVIRDVRDAVARLTRT